MTDLEKAISKWLPDVWKPGQKCKGCVKGTRIKFIEGAARNPNLVHEPHDIPCPPATRDLGFRLLEVMLRKHGAIVSLVNERGVLGVIVNMALNKRDSDLLTAIIKAAAALADKEQP